jgi:hypothetical protein
MNVSQRKYITHTVSRAGWFWAAYAALVVGAPILVHLWSAAK